ncbi:uncharacterized protein RSE6_10675 [Rhynchosporium secalis]|uniref:Uncharacterized protein n=1 Tax=Rhynchosporium secalis TaxID=38038 RepID=A0A1E1MM27_RHYSE|nr:uncharacterized protein RSE6_10675 [Rhynchosporium secalis]
MFTMNGYTVTPNHRQNRRRERPGSRTRRTITRKASVHFDLHEGIIDAHDAEIYLPSYRAKPSPLLRQNFDQNWQRWKARQAEEKAVAEMDRFQAEKEQLLLFGGELGDDELYRLGILYNDNEDLTQDFESSTIACDVPFQQSVPMFTLRQDIPQSLPPLALECPNHDNTASVSSPHRILGFNSGDWTFIHTPYHADLSSSPSSEPETWILIDDS